MINYPKGERYGVNINIGLTGNHAASYSTEKRLLAYRAALRDRDTGIKLRPSSNLLLAHIAPRTFQGPLGHYPGEPTDVLSFDVVRNYGDPATHIRHMAYQLSASLGQDCVAVEAVDEATGKVILRELVGPLADSWGDFQPDLFVSFGLADQRATASAALLITSDKAVDLTA